MSAPQAIGLIATAAAVLQIALMAFIGYPIMRRRPGGMEAFQTSGFAWWVGTLTLISGLGLIFAPSTHSWWYPSEHGASAQRILIGASVAFIACLLVEVAGERIFLGPHGSEKRTAADAKYEGALPAWAARGWPQFLVLTFVALLEEFVFRAIALGSLWHEWDLPKGLAAGIVAVAFGFSHWFYGFQQITIKLIVGSVLAWAALTGGWLAAALAHVAMNATLTALSGRRDHPAAAS